MRIKGILFTVDAVLGLIFIIILSSILFIPLQEDTKDIEKIIINNKISDLLITSQILEISDIYTIKQNYKLLMNYSGYIIIDLKKIEINQDKNIKKRIISQNIKYINSSNKEIYIEIGVYY